MTLKPVGARRDNPLHDRSPAVSPRPLQHRLSPAKAPGTRPRPHRHATQVIACLLERREASLQALLSLTPVNMFHRSGAQAGVMAQAAVAPAHAPATFSPMASLINLS